jgi:hypothetical protein
VAGSERVDLLLVSQGLAESRALAQRLVMAGQVRADGEVVDKPSRRVPVDARLAVDTGPQYVSRGGDKLAGGFGGSVGRRTESDLRVGDILDVWKVIDLQENRRLLLEAHMKVAGKAWLEFRIEGDTLVQTATHYPKGLLGRLYWYSMLPFHAFIFPDMIRSIIRQAGRMA